jgi:membrane-bound lytic murein transglycosylase D
VIALLAPPARAADPVQMPPPPGAPASSPFVYPTELEPDVRFWIRVYTEVGTGAGLLHDDRHLGLVYEVLHFDADLAPQLREKRVTEAKARYVELLRRFAAGGEPGNAHERRIRHAFGEQASAADFRDAITRIRFQLGQADRFHEGLQRAAAWETHIARSLRDLGVPEEIAALPHVESSFDTAAYSRVGAAGLWQFMPSTARRFMRVDSLVDQRLDPYSATEAAANLMLYNYRLLGSWPLAVTAYNHGPGGLRRAQDELGTSNIATILRRYQGPNFGFASRNFYVAFLAALEIDRRADGYFGPIVRLPNTESWTTELPDYIPVEALARAFRVDLGALKVLNPALRPPIWSGARFVPRGYALRLPGAAPAPAELAAAWSRLPASQRYLAQRNDGSHRMRRGETLAVVASRIGVSLSRLLAANGMRSTATVQRGETLALPLPLSRAGQGLGADLTPSTTRAPPTAITSPAAPNPAADRAPSDSAAPPVPLLAMRTPPPLDASLPPRPPAAAYLHAFGYRQIDAPEALDEPPPAGQSAGEAPPAAGASAARAASPRSPQSPQWSELPQLPRGAPPIEASLPARTRRGVHEAEFDWQPQSAALAPAAAPAGSTDTLDYSVGGDGTVVVQPAETLGYFADWCGVSVARLRALNHLKGAMVALGRRVTLDLSRVSAAQVQTARRAYHQSLQEAFFALHRIASTDSYAVKRGETLWSIAQTHADLPIWLVAQYNPDVDFNEVRSGTPIVLPKVVAINRR